MESEVVRAASEDDGFLPPGEVCNNLGLAYGELRRFKQALRTLKDCQDEVPERALLELNLGDAYRAMGRKAEARQHYRAFLEMDGITRRQRAIVQQNLDALGK